MTQALPPNFSFDYQTPQPPSAGTRRAIWPSLIAWVVILASSAALIVRPRWLEHGTGSPNSPAAPLPSIADTPSPQLQLIGRCAVGAKALSKGSANVADLVKNLDQAIFTPIDEFRAITVIGELEGDAAALDRIDDFEDMHQVVRLREDVDALRTIYADGPAKLTEHQRQLLIDRHHWFGRLAVSYGLPNTDPVRLEAMRPAGRSVLFLVIFFFLGGGALLTGIVLAILTIVLTVQRRIVPTYEPPPRSIAGPLVEAFALYLLGMVTLSHLLARLFPQLGLSLNFFLFALLPLALVYLRVRGVGWPEIRQALGWRRGRGFWREVGVGLFGYLAGLPVLAIGFAITYVLMRSTGNHATHPIANQPVDTPIEVLQIFILACIGAPIIEETMFRGALLGHLRARLPWWISAPIVSLIFAAIHPQGWVAIPVLGSIALVLAWLREWRGSLIASMTAHAFNNLVAVMVLVLLMG